MTVSTPITHVIEIVPISPTRWRAVCSAGDYTSSGHAIKNNAEQAGASHVRAKGGIPQVASR